MPNKKSFQNSKNNNNPNLNTSNHHPTSRQKTGAFSRRRSNHHTPNKSSTSTPNTTSPDTASSSSAPPSTASPTTTSSFDCAICAETENIFAVRQCGHSQICWMCTLRMLVFKEGRKCPVCKTNSDKIVLTSDPTKQLEDFDLSSLLYDNVWDLYVATQDILDKVRSLRLFKCSKCNQEFPELSLLKTHLKKKHGLFYCDLCLEHRQQFLPEQNLFTQRQLDYHMNHGDSSPQFSTGVREGHPWCEFCEEHFYDDEHIFIHMEEQHFWCHLCESNEMHVHFYEDYPSLEDHFDRSHYLCTHVNCRGLFKVFRSEIELAIHEQEEHTTGKKSKNMRLQLDFGYSEQDELNRIRRQVNQENAERRSNTVLTAKSIVFMGAGDTGPLPQRRPKRGFVNHASRTKGTSKANEYRGSQPDPSTSAIPLPPDELRSRTKAMMTMMKETLNDDTAFEEFRRISQQFQEGEIKASSYYVKFVEMFGENELSEKIFNELVTLLPHEDKKQALLMAKNTYKSGEYDSLYKSAANEKTKKKQNENNEKKQQNNYNKKKQNTKGQNNKQQQNKKKKGKKQADKLQKDSQKKQNQPKVKTIQDNQTEWPSLGAASTVSGNSTNTSFAAISNPKSSNKQQKQKQKQKNNSNKKKKNKNKNNNKLSNTSEFPSLNQSVRLAKSASKPK